MKAGGLAEGLEGVQSARRITSREFHYVMLFVCLASDRRSTVCFRYEQIRIKVWFIFLLQSRSATMSLLWSSNDDDLTNAGPNLTFFSVLAASPSEVLSAASSSLTHQRSEADLISEQRTLCSQCLLKQRPVPPSKVFFFCFFLWHRRTSGQWSSLLLQTVYPMSTGRTFWSRPGSSRWGQEGGFENPT